MTVHVRVAVFRLPFVILIGLISACAVLRPGPAGPTPAERYLQDVAWLAAPAQEGRGLATQGIQRAARYIERSFREAGLEPAFDDGYGQSFTAMVGAQAGSASSLKLHDRVLSPRHFAVLGLSSPGAFSAPVVFAGYGISAPEHDYDDYAGLDVEGKVVLLLRYEPRKRVGFDGDELTEHATFRSKVFNARRRGAAAVLMVNGPRDLPAGQDTLVSLQSDPMAGAGFGIPMLHVARDAVVPLLAREGLDLAEWQTAMDQGEPPRLRQLSFMAAGVADLRRRVLPVENVGGLLPGRDPSRVLIVGAHYDHLGFGGPHAATGSTDRIFHGADDNASGTAGILALARRYAVGEPPPVSILFLAFSGEEAGLVGSTHFVQHHLRSFGEPVAMINLDMIGRLRQGRLIVFGTGSAMEFPRKVSESAGTAIRLQKEPAGFGPSDHAPFYAAGVPVLHFWTGNHADYHRPGDTVDKVHVAGAMEVLRMVGDVVDRIQTGPMPAYQGPTRSPMMPVAVAGAPGEGILGVAPNFAAAIRGVKVASVLPGTVAAEFLRAGDVLLRLDGETLWNYYELAYWLRRRAPGDEITLDVWRRGEVHTLSLRLRGHP